MVRVNDSLRRESKMILSNGSADDCRKCESARECHGGRSMKRNILSVIPDHLSDLKSMCHREAVYEKLSKAFTCGGIFGDKNPDACFYENICAIRAASPIMKNIEGQVPLSTHKPISIGITCWLWQRSRRWTLIQLAEHLGVTLEITQHRHGLYMEIEGQVSGENVDKFISEFARRC